MSMMRHAPGWRLAYFAHFVFFVCWGLGEPPASRAQSPTPRAPVPGVVVSSTVKGASAAQEPAAEPPMPDLIADILALVPAGQSTPKADGRHRLSHPYDRGSTISGRCQAGIRTSALECSWRMLFASVGASLWVPGPKNQVEGPHYGFAGVFEFASQMIATQRFYFYFRPTIHFQDIATRSAAERRDLFCFTFGISLYVPLNRYLAWYLTGAPGACVGNLTASDALSTGRFTVSVGTGLQLTLRSAQLFFEPVALLAMFKDSEDAYLLPMSMRLGVGFSY